MTENRIIVQDVEHSILGASGAHRWMNCAGSVQVIRELVKDLKPSDLDAFERGGPAASEGTAAHAIAAKCLHEGKDAWELMDTKVVADGREFTVDSEMAEGVQVHLDLVHRLMEEYSEQGARLYIEHSMASILDEQAFGSADVIIFVPGVKIIIIDFKYGKHIVVEPDSVQNRYYGYLVIENFESEGIEDVELWITQPRIRHPRGVVRKHQATRADVTAWFESDVIEAMAATRSPDAQLTIGDWCRFCPARDVCPALRKETLDFDMTLSPEYMTGEELGRVMQRAAAIKNYLDKLSEEAFQRARRGEDIAGYKLVRKKASRIWKNGADEALKKQYGDDAYLPRVVRSAPNVEKELKDGKRFVARWAFMPDTGLTLAANSDKREPVRLSGEEFFGDEPVDV